MPIAPAIGAAALAVSFLSVGTHASAQAIPEPTVAFRQAQSPNHAKPDNAPSGQKVPSNLRLNLVSIARGASGAILGAGIGLVVDGEKCEREHAGKPDTSL